MAQLLVTMFLEEASTRHGKLALVGSSILGILSAIVTADPEVIRVWTLGILSVFVAGLALIGPAIMRVAKMFREEGGRRAAQRLKELEAENRVRNKQRLAEIDIENQSYQVKYEREVEEHKKDLQRHEADMKKKDEEIAFQTQAREKQKQENAELWEDMKALRDRNSELEGRYLADNRVKSPAETKPKSKSP